MWVERKGNKTASRCRLLVTKNRSCLLIERKINSNFTVELLLLIGDVGQSYLHAIIFMMTVSREAVK